MCNKNRLKTKEKNNKKNVVKRKCQLEEKPYFMTKAKNFTDTKHSMAQERK